MNVKLEGNMSDWFGNASQLQAMMLKEHLLKNLKADLEIEFEKMFGDYINKRYLDMLDKQNKRYV